MLKLTDIQKSYGNHLIFSIKELVLPPGIYWLQGANGAGKSTLMKILAGEIPFTGEICMHENISLRKKPVAYRQRLNHAEAEPQFPEFLKGSDLVEFVRRVKKGDAAQIKKIRDNLQIESYLENPVGTYSSGMLKKLSLLLAFTGHPDWILLDEPLTTIDTESQKNLCRLIMDRHREGTSFLLTSHHAIQQTSIVFDRTYKMESKQVQEIPLPNLPKTPARP